MKLIKRSFFVLFTTLLALFMGPFEIAATLWNRTVLGRGCVPVAFMADAYASVLENVESVLKRNFSEATSFAQTIQTLTDGQAKHVEEAASLTLDLQADRQFKFYVAKENDVVLGYAVEDWVHGKWGPIHYLLTLDPGGEISDVTVLEYRERRGKPIARRRFLGQFFGKTIEDPLMLQRDIQGVTGASISSRGVTDGIRKLLHVFKVFYGS